MRGSRVAIALFFFADGLLLGSWAARIPAVQTQAGLTNARLGLALFASSVGALMAMPLAGWLCDRVGSRRVAIGALLTAIVSLWVTSLATGLAGLAVPLFGFGAGFGSVNVAANAQGITLERAYGWSILSSFHAAFSFGGLTGAGTGALAAGAGAAPRVHFAALAVGVAVASLVAQRRLLPLSRANTRVRQRHVVRSHRTVLILGSAAFCALLAEGSAADWSAAYLSQSVGVTAAVAALGYTAFSVAMATSRTLGDRLYWRFGPVALARVGGGFAAAGLATGLAVGSAPVALAGFAAMGAGLGVVVPILFRAAGSTPGLSAVVGVAAVSTIGWLGFLAGPPVIGFAAGAVGLRWALGLVVLAILTLVMLLRGSALRCEDASKRVAIAPPARSRDQRVVVGSCATAD